VQVVDVEYLKEKTMSTAQTQIAETKSLRNNKEVERFTTIGLTEALGT
jgi:hypothetical protein